MEEALLLWMKRVFARSTNLPLGPGYSIIRYSQAGRQEWLLRATVEQLSCQGPGHRVLVKGMGNESIQTQTIKSLLFQEYVKTTDPNHQKPPLSRICQNYRPKPSKSPSFKNIIKTSQTTCSPIKFSASISFQRGFFICFEDQSLVVDRVYVIKWRRLCGGLTTANYKEMNEVYAKYKDQGLEILAFPCNQFGEEEPGDNTQIAEKICTRFKAEFPIFEKIEVNGSNAAPIYKFLKSSKGGTFGDSIKWNFTKFLVDKDGNVVERYAPTTSPLSFEKDVKKLLGVA